MAKKAEEKEEGPKGKGGFIKIALGAVALLAVGAGGAYGAFAAGLIGDTGSGEPDIPKLVRKGDTDPYAMEESGGGKDAGPVVYGEGGSEYRTAYYSFEETFTSNLADSASLIQVELAVSTQRDGRVLQWVKNHELAIRSVILTQLAETREEEVFDVKGKEDLAKRLTKSVNEVLEENEGFGGVENVHFKGLLVQ